ncbi:MAG: DNA topoisomerase III [Clostridiales bacterium]|nr:DNA topoisomerase III [Clostridiales bacterium]
MGKILVIAEKPSVGRDIARVLKCTKKGEGFLFSEEYIVSWAIGHLVTLCDPEDYDEGLKKWRYETLPIMPAEIKLKPVPNTKSQLNILKKLMTDKDVDSLICATDSGREGELIFRYIYRIVKSKKPFQRLWNSSMTDQAIKDGFANLKDGAVYDHLYLSAKCRSEADWLVGINASRAYTIRYNALLSIGRVQTPTLAILVDRQKEINAFDPKDYWEITAFFEGYKGKWFNPEDQETKLYDKEKADGIAEKVKGKTGVVKSIEKEEKRQPPPLLYDLTELQRDGNRKFGFSASKTLSIAQDLYEKRKMITYPRTDSRYLSADMKSKVAATLKKLNIDPYKKYVQTVLDLPQLPFSKRMIDDAKVTDHHAIIPTDGNINLAALSADELKIYDLIARRFIAAFYPAYIYHITKIITIAESENFLTKRMTVAQYGYMELYREEKTAQKKSKKSEDDDLSAVLPDVKEKDAVSVSDALSEQKKTKPPKLYNEATLLSAMENAGRLVEDEDLKEQLKDSGLGTPATRAAIIERLIQVNYIERKAKNLIPTEKGMKLIAVVPPEMKSAETTGKWERGLSSVAKGTMEPERFMGSIHRYVRYLIGQSAAGGISVVFEQEDRGRGKGKSAAIGKCPLCENGAVFENSKAYFCSGWKNGCQFKIWKDSTAQYGFTLDKPTLKKLLAQKKVPDVRLTLPQTQEKCKADLVFKDNANGAVAFVNLERLPMEETAKID